MLLACPALCDPTDCSLPDSSVYRIFQARILEWVASPFSRDLPNPGIEPRSPTLQVDSLPAEPPGIRRDSWRTRIRSHCDVICMLLLHELYGYLEGSIEIMGDPNLSGHPCPCHLFPIWVYFWHYILALCRLIVFP